MRRYCDDGPIDVVHQGDLCFDRRPVFANRLGHDRVGWMPTGAKAPRPSAAWALVFSSPVGPKCGSQVTMQEDSCRDRSRAGSAGRPPGTAATRCRRRVPLISVMTTSTSRPSTACPIARIRSLISLVMCGWPGRCRRGSPRRSLAITLGVRPAGGDVGDLAEVSVEGSVRSVRCRGRSRPRRWSRRPHRCWNGFIVPGIDVEVGVQLLHGDAPDAPGAELRGWTP